MEKILKSLEWVIERTSLEYGLTKEEAIEAIAISLEQGDYQEKMIMDVFYVAETHFGKDKV